MATSNPTSGRAHFHISPNPLIYTASVSGRFARFYAGERLVMVQRFPSNADAAREAAHYLMTMGASPQVQAALGGRQAVV